MMGLRAVFRAHGDRPEPRPIMRRTVLIAATAWWLLTFSLNAATWQTDYTAAMQAAKSQNRMGLINFTGSDWCGWCIRLKQEVFDTPEFTQFANNQLVLLEIDFPRSKAQSAAQVQANRSLQQQFGVRGFPTLFLVNSEGKVVQQLGYMPGGPKAFLEELGKSMPVTAMNPGTPAPKATYDKLVLKGITGSAKSPLALINGKTFGAGDSYKVQAGTNTFKVTCVSIAADHAVVQVEGEKETRKLTLGEK